jgi:hypothetical protein
VRVGFEKSGESLDGMSLVLDTELIRYKWRGADGNFPDYEKLIPADFKTFVSFDANEAVKAVSSLKVLSDSKSYPVDLTIGGGKLTMSIPDDKGQAEIPADTQGDDSKVRLDGGYLSDALRACGGMVDLKLVDAKSPMLFSVDGYELVTMPMYSPEKPKAEAEVEPETTEAGGEPAESTTDVVAEAEAIAEAKATEPAETAEATERTEKSRRKSGKRKVREPVAV